MLTFLFLLFFTVNSQSYINAIENSWPFQISKISTYLDYILLLSENQFFNNQPLTGQNVTNNVVFIEELAFIPDQILLVLS